MQKLLEYKNTQIQYTIRKSRRAKNIAIYINRDSKIEVVIPFRITERYAERFVKEKADWIAKSIQKTKKYKTLPSQGTREEYLKYKDLAHEVISKKVLYWNDVFKFEYNRICIKNMKTQWGSCSCKSNLNFNYKILFLPEHIVDYLIVHELAHLQEMNHSKRFWVLVESVLPEYKKANKELKNINL